MDLKQVQTKHYGIWLDIGGLLFIALIGLVDYFIGFEAFLTILYLFPVLLITWYGSLVRGIFISVISVLAWFVFTSTGEPQISVLISPFINMIGIWGTFLIVIVIVSGFRTSLKKEQMLSLEDKLTHAISNRAFIEILAKEIKRTARYNRSLTLVYMGVNDMDGVNKKYGREVGDRLLVTVAETIKHNLRTSDSISRLGGDEFGILLPETDHDQAQIVMAKVQKTLNIIMEQNKWKVTYNIGMVACHGEVTSLEELLKQADELMKQAKNDETNNIKSQIHSSAL